MIIFKNDEMVFLIDEAWLYRKVLIGEGFDV